MITVALLDFPWLKTKQDFYQDSPPLVIQQAQETLAWADHWVFIYPLWLGTLPALLKAFLEQALRPKFAFSMNDPSRMGQKLLKGKTARLVVTMGMPALIFKWFYRSHSLKSFERNILSFSGVAPIKETLIGRVESMTSESRQRWLVKMNDLGRKGQ